MKYTILYLLLFISLNQGFGQDTTSQQAKTILSYLGYDLDKERVFKDFTDEVDGQKIFIEEQRDSFLLLLTDDAYQKLERKLVDPLIRMVNPEEVSKFYHFFEQPLGEKMLAHSPNISEHFHPLETWKPTSSLKSKYTLEEQKTMEIFFKYQSTFSLGIPLLKKTLDQNIKYWKKVIIYNAFQSVKNKFKYLYNIEAVGAKEFYQGKFKFFYEPEEIVDIDTNIPPPPPPPVIFTIQGDIFSLYVLDKLEQQSRIIWLTDCRYIFIGLDDDIEKAKQTNPNNLDNSDLYHVFEIKDNIMSVVTKEGITKFQKIE